MRKAYTVSQKAEAVALAVVSGAEYAAEQLGIDVRTVRVWAAKAGKSPELAAPETGWRSVLDLAMARVNAALAGGSVRPKDAAVIAAIASRNIREPKVEPRNEAEDAYDAFVAEVEARYPDPHQEHLALVALLRYHQGHGCVSDDDGTYPNPCPEPLADKWAYLDSLGNLEDWLEACDAWEDAAIERQIERNREVQEAARLAALDAETRALVEAAEAWLRETVA